MSRLWIGGATDSRTSPWLETNILVDYAAAMLCTTRYLPLTDLRQLADVAPSLRDVEALAEAGGLEKRQISDALARVDAQREKLSGRLSELEATERVLAFHTGPLKARICAKATGSKKGSRRSLHGDGVPVPHRNPMS